MKHEPLIPFKGGRAESYNVLGQRHLISRRELLKRGGIAIAAPALLSPVLLAACQAEPSRPQSSTLRIRLEEEGSSFDPAFLANNTDWAIDRCVYENLIAYPPDGDAPMNVLAESFTISADGRNIAFRLRRGIRFHSDFGELTASDVKFSLERIAGLTVPLIDSPYKDLFSALAGVEIEDDLSGTIRLERTSAGFLTHVLPGPYGLIVSRRAFEELGDDAATRPIGTGPYQFGEWVRRDHITLNRFPSWKGSSALSRVDSIRFVEIPDAAASELALEAGDIDFTLLRQSSVQRFVSNADFQTAEGITSSYNWVGMNVVDPALSDLNVRRAIRLAIDVPAILEAAFEGRNRRATSLIAPSVPVGYWADAPTYDRSISEAEALLAQAASRPSRLTYTSANDAASTTVGEIVKENLRDLGIDVEIILQDAATFYTTGESNRSRQLFYTQYGLPLYRDPNAELVWFTCDNIDQWNYMYWCDEQYDRLFAEVDRTLDSNQRNDMYVRMQQLMDDAAIAIWVSWPTNYFAWTPEVDAVVSEGGEAYYEMFSISG